MTQDPLKTSVQFVPGVGPQRAELLARLDLHTVEDLLWNVPRDVLDLTEVRSPADLVEDELQTVRGTVVDMDGREISGGRSMTAVLLDCGVKGSDSVDRLQAAGETESAKRQSRKPEVRSLKTAAGPALVRGVWFNQLWVLKKFQTGQHVLFSAKPKRRGGRWEFTHPRVQWLEDDPDASGGVLPRYRLTEGLKMHDMRRITRAAVERFAGDVPEFLPPTFRESMTLPHVQQAVRHLHLPASIDEYHAGRRRVIFDDLLEFELGLALPPAGMEAPGPCARVANNPQDRCAYPSSVSIRIDTGQNQAIAEISGDLASGRAMHRLLQADVGAGKTAVALYSMLITVAAGYQAVLMAPTEVLANQHWGTFENALAHSRVNRLLLTGNLSRTQRRDALERIASGDVQLIVGTQAVIQKDVRFHKLGLAVIDEQHKFGVMQRAHFSSVEPPVEPRSKESPEAPELAPHVLVMTATPIPRSLCLTQFGDLDVTAIRDMPPGRQQVVTNRIISAQQRQRAWEFIRKQLQTGRQAYVVCPRIEAESETGSAEHMYQVLSAGELRGFRVGLVHGQLDSELKGRAMLEFRDGRLQVLVATTVVEVGLDVPNATLLVVSEAERFGLSQLHQLRGRIARGKFQGYCFLFSETDNPDALQRLGALEANADGFQIAEADFRLRGPGDILGTRQHGELPLKVADLTEDAEVLAVARNAAFELVDSGRFDEPEFVPLKVRVLERFGDLMELPQSG